MQVRDAMSSVVLTVGPGHSLREVAQLMAARKVGAAVVSDPDSAGTGILTERDVLEAVATGVDLDVEQTHAHITTDLVVASPDWDLQQAADAMLRGGFRHLVVCDAGEVVGVISMRDLVRCWARQPIG